MCSHGVCHTCRCDAELGYVVVVVAVGVLHVLCAARTLECLCGSGVVVLVEIEVQNFESALSVSEAVVAPEVGIYVARHHDGCLAADIDVDAVGGSVSRLHAEGCHEVNRRAAPSAPAVAVLVEVLRHEVALQGVL